MVKVKNAARQGYTTIRGDSCSSQPDAHKGQTDHDGQQDAKIPHKIHAGKNDPRMLKVGAREHPVAASRPMTQARRRAV